jgi:hypothetical protein
LRKGRKKPDSHRKRRHFKGADAAEPDISGLIGHLKETGLVFEDEDVRRMARVVALRRAQKSL